MTETELRHMLGGLVVGLVIGAVIGAFILALMKGSTAADVAWATTQEPAEIRRTFYGSVEHLGEWRITAHDAPCEICRTVSIVDGEHVWGNMAAVNERELQGKWIYIEGVGFYQVRYRIGGSAARQVDILKPSHETALEFGVRKANIWIVEGCN